MFWFRVSIYIFCLSLTLPVWAELSAIQVDGPLAAQSQQPEITLAAMVPAIPGQSQPTLAEPIDTSDSAKQEIVEPIIDEDEEMALTAIFTDYEKAATEKAELLEESPFEDSDGIIVKAEQGEVLLESNEESSL